MVQTVWRWTALFSLGGAVALSCGAQQLDNGRENADATGASPTTSSPAGASEKAAAQSAFPNEYIVIHAPGLGEVAEEWAAYRRSHGWTADSISAVDAAGLLPPHWNDADLMRDGLQQYFRDRFGQASNTRGVRGGRFAVLLLGDVDMPDGSLGISTWTHPKTIETLRSEWEVDNVASDHEYQLLDDDDDLPDFLLGRIPARTPAEARIALDKIKRYETETAPGPWRRRISYVASVGGFGPIDRIIERTFILMLKRALPPAFDVSMTYTKPDSPYCAPPSRFASYVTNRINEGALVVNYVGHGWWDSLDTLRWRGERYPVCHADHLEDLAVEDGRYPIMVIIACSTGRFDLKDGQTSLAERLIFHPEGPIAVIAGSRVTHPYANALFQKNLTEQFGAVQRETLGAADLVATRNLMRLDEETAKLELLSGPIMMSAGESASAEDLRRVHMSLYNLIGDPGLRIAYPELEVTNLGIADDDDGRGASVVGEVGGISSGHVIVTIETDRAEIHRADELLHVFGADDPELEAKAATNYTIANDKTIIEVTGEVKDGRFRVTLPPTGAAQAPWREHGDWIKAYVTSSDSDADAFGAALIEHDASEDRLDDEAQ